MSCFQRHRNECLRRLLDSDSTDQVACIAEEFQLRESSVNDCGGKCCLMFTMSICCGLDSEKVLQSLVITVRCEFCVVGCFRLKGAASYYGNVMQS